MKFVKTAVAVAITGIAAAPMIASAETTLSGVVEIKYAGVETDREGEQEDVSMQAGDVRLGVVSEHELDSGLIGYGSIKFTLDDLLGEIAGEKGVTVPGGPTATGSESDQALDGTVKADDIYVGLKGGFGDIRFGEIPLAVEYGQLANDIHDVADDVGDGASYTGTFGPASIILNHSSANANDSDMYGAGAKFNFAGATIGIGFEDRDENTNVAAGLSYAIAGFSIAAQYWAQEIDGFELDASEEDDDIIDFSNTDIDDTTNIAFKVGYTIFGVSAAVTYSILETQVPLTTDEGVDVEGEPGSTASGVIGTGDAEEEVIRLDLGYDLGGGLNLSTRIDNVSNDGEDEDLLKYRFQLAKTF